VRNLNCLDFAFQDSCGSHLPAGCSNWRAEDSPLVIT
jgi:hypothetical protein